MQHRLLPQMIILLAACLLLAAPAAAQDRLSADLVTAEAHDQPQRQQIRDYAAQWLEVLLQGQPEQIPQARSRLLQPLNMEPSDSFLSIYAPALQPEDDGADGPVLSQGLQSDKPLATRLNTIIVLTNLPGQQSIDLLVDALEDPNPAVRYWAAKAIGRLAGENQFTTQRRQDLLDTLLTRLNEDETAAVCQQILLAAGEIDATRMLEILNDRLNQIARKPGQSVLAEQVALRQFYLDLAAAGDADPDLVEELGRTALRYLRLAARELDSQRVGGQQADIYAGTVRVADNALRFVHGNRNSSVDHPGSLDSLINSENWQTVLQRADQWERALQASPFNFSQEELSIPAPPQDEEETDDQEADPNAGQAPQE
ncbi:MAG: HEAT repeat domain-containing protein [Phycisphaeraceae bacterium]